MHGVTPLVPPYWPFPMHPARKNNAHVPALALTVLVCLAVSALPSGAVEARRESAHMLQRAIAAGTRPILGQCSELVAQGVHWALVQGPAKR